MYTPCRTTHQPQKEQLAKAKQKRYLHTNSNEENVKRTTHRVIHKLKQRRYKQEEIFKKVNLWIDRKYLNKKQKL